MIDNLIKFYNVCAHYLSNHSDKNFVNELYWILEDHQCYPQRSPLDVQKWLSETEPLVIKK